MTHFIIREDEIFDYKDCDTFLQCENGVPSLLLPFKSRGEDIFLLVQQWVISFF